MRVAAVQMVCRSDREANLARATDLVAQAVRAGATFVALPELFASLGTGTAMRAGAEPLDGPTVRWAVEQAERSRIWLLAGSFVERDRELLYNTSTLIAPTGGVVARYRKIHLFDVEVEGAGTHESAVFAAGTDVVSADVDSVAVGLTTCYDLRFPELFRILALRGTRMIVMPSAFTAATGQPHWEPLVRARAIENQVFVVAPDQCGASADGIARHGHSLIVDPWGRVIGDGGSDEGLVVVDIDLGEVDRARRSIPSLANRRPDRYVWPDRPV
jgi:predicted amidohydrolase